MCWIPSRWAVLGAVGLLVCVCLGVWLGGVLPGGSVDTTVVEAPSKLGMVLPPEVRGGTGATQNPEVFNFYVERFEKKLGKMPCRAKSGEKVEPCITDTLDFLLQKVQSYGN